MKWTRIHATEMDNLRMVSYLLPVFGSILNIHTPRKEKRNTRARNFSHHAPAEKLVEKHNFFMFYNWKSLLHCEFLRVITLCYLLNNSLFYVGMNGERATIFYSRLRNLLKIAFRRSNEEGLNALYSLCYVL